MIYERKRLDPPERIAEGEYKGFTYYVLNLGTHPCAYVDVTNTNLHGKDYSDIDIECHCGLTYSREYLNTVEKNGWFIGWDYAHYCDFVGYYLAVRDESTGKLVSDLGSESKKCWIFRRSAESAIRDYSDPLITYGKKWTTEEIVDECKCVIDQIVKKYIGE
jgi:hypothetical protein